VSAAAARAGAPRARFDETFLRRLESLRVVTKRASLGQLRADRRSRRMGAGIEFADHRDYVAGDDLRTLDWIKKDRISKDIPYFYALYRQEYPCKHGSDYVLLNTKGKGHYVGTVLAVRTRSPMWFGEGDEKIYIDGENFSGVRADVTLDPDAPDIKIAWKALYSSKDTWMGPTLNMGAVPSIYNLTMDPYEKYDMMFNGAVSTRNPPSSPGRYSGMDNGWALSLVDIPLSEFNQSIVKYPNIERFPGGASNDMIPNLQSPKNPLPYDPVKQSKTVGAGGG